MEVLSFFQVDRGVGRDGRDDDAAADLERFLGPGHTAEIRIVQDRTGRERLSELRPHDLEWKDFSEITRRRAIGQVMGEVDLGLSVGLSVRPDVEVAGQSAERAPVV